jgi:hypothetical protein
MGSYDENDVVFLLKEIGSDVKESDSFEREQLIQSGVHYSELLPQEYEPTKEYMDIFFNELGKTKRKMAELIAITANKILKYTGSQTVLVSLARAGTPVGVLIKKYMENVVRVSNIPHYSISIIRGKGFDEKALRYIIQEHGDKHIVFVDGWTGKGAIKQQLTTACGSFNSKYNTNVRPDLAVVADPAKAANIYGTQEDYLLPSACLNSTVSGLVSRTFHRADIIGSDDYHGARYYRNLQDSDVSNMFIGIVTSNFRYTDTQNVGDAMYYITSPEWTGIRTTKNIGEAFNITDINHIKPGVGETTRVLLRRVPWKILVRPDKLAELTHILQLAKDRNVEIVEYSDMEYACCGLIKSVGGVQ